jgi:RES domain-containing protein
LSCLEKLAHTSGTSLYAGNFSVTIYHIPDKLPLKEITLTQLQKQNHQWHKVANYPMTQSIGFEWLQDRGTAVLKVPSAIIDLEYNYLLNPAHADFHKIKIAGVRPFSFDARFTTPR